MKKQALILILALIFAQLAAQTTDPAVKKRNPVLLQVESGISIPVGKNYSDLDRTNTKAGFAANGFYIGLGAVWMGEKDFGVGIHYTFQHNPLQPEAHDLIPYGGVDSLGSGSWNNHYLMIGPTYHATFSKFLVEVTLMGGLALTFSPVFETQDPYTQERKSHPAFGFGLGAGIGLGYNITPKIALKVSAGYRGCYPQATVEYQQLVYDSVSQQNLVQATDYESKKTVSTFQAGLGLTIKL